MPLSATREPSTEPFEQCVDLFGAVFDKQVLDAESAQGCHGEMDVQVVLVTLHKQREDSALELQLFRQSPPNLDVIDRFGH